MASSGWNRTKFPSYPSSPVCEDKGTWAIVSPVAEFTTGENLRSHRLPVYVVGERARPNTGRLIQALHP